MKKSFLLALFSAVCLITVASAAETATVYSQSIYVEGQPVVCLNEQGALVPLIRYQDSTYIPVRTAGEWMGKTVAWDNASQTISLSGAEQPRFYNGYDALEAPSALTSADTVSIVKQPQVSTLLDGVKQSFKNQRGETVAPISYRNVNYLPLRSIGELAGMEVTWISPTSGLEIIYLRTPLSETQRAELKTYIDTQYKALDALGTPLLALYRGTKDVEGALYQAKSQMKEMLSRALPTADMAQFGVSRFLEDMKQMEVQISALSASDSPTELAQKAEQMLDARGKAATWLVLVSSCETQEGLADLPEPVVGFNY